MAVSRPILLLGPESCHAADIMHGAAIGWSVQHGDIDRAEAILREIYTTPSAVLAKMGRAAREIVDRQFTKARLCNQFCDVIEGIYSSVDLGRSARKSSSTHTRVPAGASSPQ
jgi:hypothetical protein